MVTDRELFNRWRAGDATAGSELFERHFDSISRFFENKIQGDTDDLVQRTFLACVDARERFREESSFRTFLFGIARRQLYRYYRDNRRRGGNLDFGVSSVADLAPGPVTKAGANEDRELLLRALCSLPVELQLLLELFYWENMDGDSLAEVFDVSPTTIRTRLYRARKNLRDRMAELAANPRSLFASVDNLDAWARKLNENRSRLG